MRLLIKLGCRIITVLWVKFILCKVVCGYVQSIDGLFGMQEALAHGPVLLDSAGELVLKLRDHLEIVVLLDLKIAQCLLLHSLDLGNLLLHLRDFPLNSLILEHQLAFLLSYGGDLIIQLSFLLGHILVGLVQLVLQTFNMELHLLFTLDMGTAL
jgi:hypothetical protein